MQQITYVCATGERRRTNSPVTNKMCENTLHIFYYTRAGRLAVDLESPLDIRWCLARSGFRRSGTFPQSTYRDAALAG